MMNTPPELDGLGTSKLPMLSDQEVVLMSVSLGTVLYPGHNGDHAAMCESQILPGATFCPSTTGAVATWLAWWKAVWAGLVMRGGSIGSAEHTFSNSLCTIVTTDH